MTAQASIVVSGGVLDGHSFLIRKPEFTIGRVDEKDVDLVIPDDPVVSRRHCRIRVLSPDEGVFEIVDAETLNGTWVNDVRVTRTILAHGDRISIGSSTVLVFFSHEGEVEAPQFEPEGATPDSTIEWSPEEVRRFSTAEGHLTLSEARLEALLGLAGSIHSLPDVRAIQYRTLEVLFGAVLCERGAILLTGIESAAGWRTPEGACQPPPVSRTIFKRVVERGVAELSHDTGSDRDFRNVQSVDKHRTRSLLAVPLVTSGRPAGMIWLEAGKPGLFNPDHLRFVAVAGGVAARAIENARQRAALELENLTLQKAAGTRHAIVGESLPIRKVHEFIRRVAGANHPVLILGQSGTGKELAARAIHEQSPRANRRFVAVNCATLSDTLLESDLFGHERGAFTGAVARKEGKLEYAEGGTLFLDEVGELTPQAQAKLLRVVQEREFERVGGTRTIKTDVRILAATNRNLKDEIAAGRFREDLYFRLNVLSVEMPALRDRRSDIPLIAQYWLRRTDAGPRQIREISTEALECLIAYSWPGNVRELGNAIERAIILGASSRLEPEDLPDEVLAAYGRPANRDASASRYQDGLRLAKLNLVRQALDEANGDHGDAARSLGIHVTYLYRLIRALGLKP